MIWTIRVRNSTVRGARASASSAGVMAGAPNVAGWPVMATQMDPRSRRWVWVRPLAGATALSTPLLMAYTSSALGDSSVAIG